MHQDLAEGAQAIFWNDDGGPPPARLGDAQVSPLRIFFEVEEKLLVFDLEVLCFQHLVQNRILRVTPRSHYNGQSPRPANIVTSQSIYLDHNATTPLDPEVREAMRPYLDERFGNPSSITHALGTQARDALEAAREQVAKLVGASEPSEIVFTSCATESNNLAIKGTAWALRDAGTRIVASAVEHPSVLESCRWLEAERFLLAIVPVDGEGRVDPEAVAHTIVPGTILLTVQHASGEVGSVQPIGEIGMVAKRAGVRFHVDATQAIGKLPVDVNALGCDLLSLSAHKIYGPKGVGALYVRRRQRLVPLMSGGGQEKGRRSGTPNVAGIVGLGVACRLAAERLASDPPRLAILSARLDQAILAEIPGAHRNGPKEGRLPGNCNVSFDDIDGQALTQATHALAFSSGSACSAGSTEPSPVLIAMGHSPERAFGSVRFGFGRTNTDADVDAAVAALVPAVASLRALSARI